jgi:hypothetical protein
MEAPSNSGGGFSAPSGRGGVSGGGRGGPGGGRFNQADMEKMMQEQKAWYKYTISIPGLQKAF